MVIKEKVLKAVTRQINAELYSSYLYLAMASYFESITLLGCAHWMKVQAKEEDGHAMRFYKYVFDRSAKVVLAGIDAPPSEWKSPIDAFKQAYGHEMKITQMICDILKVAKAEGDPATENMLQWFVNEQVEEEAQVKLIIEKLHMIKDNVGGLMILDQELGGRK